METISIGTTLETTSETILGDFEFLRERHNEIIIGKLLVTVSVTILGTNPSQDWF